MISSMVTSFLMSKALTVVCLMPGLSADYAPIFRNAPKSVKFDCKRVYLELYAGAKVATRALRKDGCAVIAFEIDDGPEFDLTRACVHQIILGWIRGGCVAAVFLGTQCIARPGPEPDEGRLVPAGAPSGATLAFLVSPACVIGT